MYAKLKMRLENTEVSFWQSSNLQGIIMENIDTNYAEKLHGNQLNPYSQYITKENGTPVWNIHTYTEEAYKNIILPMQKLREITIRKKELHMNIGEKELTTCMEKDLVDEFYTENCSKYLNVSFLTPTSFKQEGKYVIYPDLKLIYGSLMRKYSAASETMDMLDENTLTELVEHSEIIQYRLQTVPFPVEKVRIYGFTGTIVIRVNGPETLARYIRLLLEFGEYSGVGIKTGIGMGAMEYNGRRKKND